MRTFLSLLLLLGLAVQTSGDRRAILLSKKVAAGGGGGEPPGTSFVTSTPSGTPRNDFTGCVGFDFVTDGDGMTVTALARWVISGNSQTHAVTIYRSSDNVVMATVNINTSGASPGWKWETITPVALAASTAYHLVSAETDGGDEWLNTHAITYTSEAEVGSAHSRFAADCASWAGVAVDESYVGVNLKH